MAVPGAIAAVAQSYLPVTWNELATNAPGYGEETLQQKVDFVKYQLFGSVIDPNTEDQLLDPLVIEYAGILVALQIIPSGAEYWSAQRTSFTAQGDRNEVVTFGDRSEALWKLQQQLITKSRSMLPDVQAILGTTIKARVRRPPISVGEAGDTGLLTPDPFQFPRQSEPVTTTGAL